MKHKYENELNINENHFVLDLDFIHLNWRDRWQSERTTSRQIETCAMQGAFDCAIIAINIAFVQFGVGVGANIIGGVECAAAIKYPNLRTLNDHFNR